MSNTATDTFDLHPIWEEFETIEQWLTKLSESYGPGYVGLPDLANEFLRRIDVVTKLTRSTIELTPKEAISKSFLDEIKVSLTKIIVELQQIDWDDQNDHDQALSEANDASEALLTSIYTLRNQLADFTKACKEADKRERERVNGFIEKCSELICDIENSSIHLQEQISTIRATSNKELEDLRTQISEVAESFEVEISEGVEAGKKRIDDQITTLQNQYNSEIEKQKTSAKDELELILKEVRAQKAELDKMVENAQKVSGYMAEDSLSRMFKERAIEAKSLWTWYTIFGGIVSGLSVLILYFAGHAALGTDLSGADIVRSVVRTLLGLGAGAFAAYLLRQASIQQRSFQDSRSAEARLGSLEAFLAQFNAEDAMEIRRGVGQRVYIDGELGETARLSVAADTPKALALEKAESNPGDVTSKESKGTNN